MRTLTERGTGMQTWRAAADLAAFAPEGRVPCPGCGASVKGANLGEHVRRVHMRGDEARRDGERSGIVGIDRRIRTTGRTLAALWLVGVVTQLDRDRAATTQVGRLLDAIESGPTVATVRPHLEALAGTTFGTVLLAGLGAIGLALVAGRTRLLRARLEVDGRHLVLHHRLGTGRRRVLLTGPVQTGALVRMVGGSGGDETGSGEPAEEVRIGTYLHVGSGRRGITVGCPSGTKVRRQWEGLAAGPTRSRWDITVTPGELVALQYALAGRGLLTPRATALA